MLKYLWFIVPVVLLTISFFELYRLSHVTVAYKDSIGQLKGYSFYYMHHWNDRWLNIQEWENRLAEVKNMPTVKIISIKINTKWRIRRI